jgi:hypothetical protein
MFSNLSPVKENTNITPKDLITWFRVKAEEFNTIAETLQSTFDSGNGSPKPPNVVVLTPKDLTLDQVKALAKKPTRASSIGQKLGTTRESVVDVITKHPEAFETIGRGWIKAK